MTNEFDPMNPDAGFDLTGGGGFTGDDNMVLDLGSVSEEMPGFEAVPPGVYSAIVENTDFTISQNSGNPMISWQFRIIDAQFDNRLMFYHTVLNKESGLSRLKRLMLRVCPDYDLSQFKPKDFCDSGFALGRPCRVKVRIRPYQGKRVNDVTDILGPADDGFMSVAPGLE